MGNTILRYRYRNTIEAPRIIKPMTDDVILTPNAENSLEDGSGVLVFSGASFSDGCVGFSDPALSLLSNGVLNDL
jgi:hypothetical protein